MTSPELAEHVRELVDQAPPLTPEQRDRLAVLLAAGPPQPASGQPEAEDAA